MRVFSVKTLVFACFASLQVVEAVGESIVFLRSDYHLGCDSTLYFESDGYAKEMVLDGAGHAIKFNIDPGCYFAIDENVTLTLQNVALKNFNPSKINFRGSGETLAELCFGDNVTIELNQDLSITQPWIFIGCASILGNGCRLTLAWDNMLQLKASVDLEVAGVELVKKTADAIEVAPSAQLDLRESSVKESFYPERALRRDDFYDRWRHY